MDLGCKAQQQNSLSCSRVAWKSGSRGKFGNTESAAKPALTNRAGDDGPMPCRLGSMIQLFDLTMPPALRLPAWPLSCVCACRMTFRERAVGCPSAVERSRSQRVRTMSLCGSMSRPGEFRGVGLTDMYRLIPTRVQSGSARRLIVALRWGSRQMESPHLALATPVIHVRRHVPVRRDRYRLSRAGCRVQLPREQSQRGLARSVP